MGKQGVRTLHPEQSPGVPSDPNTQDKPHSTHRPLHKRRAGSPTHRGLQDVHLSRAQRVRLDCHRLSQDPCGKGGSTGTISRELGRAGSDEPLLQGATLGPEVTVTQGKSALLVPTRTRHDLLATSLLPGSKLAAGLPRPTGATPSPASDPAQPLRNAGEP